MSLIGQWAAALLKPLSKTEIEGIALRTTRQSCMEEFHELRCLWFPMAAFNARNEQASTLHAISGEAETSSRPDIVSPEPWTAEVRLVHGAWALGSQHCQVAQLATLSCRLTLLNHSQGSLPRYNGIAQSSPRSPLEIQNMSRQPIQTNLQVLDSLRRQISK
jgi:hypothetical protein